MKVKITYTVNVDVTERIAIAQAYGDASRETIRQLYEDLGRGGVEEIVTDYEAKLSGSGADE